MKKVELTDTGGNPIKRPCPKAIAKVLAAPDEFKYSLVSCEKAGAYIHRDEDDYHFSTIYDAEISCDKAGLPELIGLFWKYAQNPPPAPPDDSYEENSREE